MSPQAHPRPGAPQGGRRCLLVLNGRSRSGAQARGPILDALVELGADLAGGAPVPPEGLDGALRRLGPGALDRILVGGVDGTLNTALPALLRVGVPLGVLPLGTANDFAGALGIPTAPWEAVGVALGGRMVRVDLGRVEGRPFLNVASIGLGAR